MSSEDDEYRRALAASLNDTGPVRDDVADEEYRMAMEASLQSSNSVDSEELRKAMEEAMEASMNTLGEEIAAKREAEQLAEQLVAQAIEDSKKYRYADRAQAIVVAAGPIPPGRVRLCLEMPKGIGGLLVGADHKHARVIASAVGDDCTIRFLSRRQSASIPDMQGDCIILEANSDAALCRAENAVTSRVADLTISPSRKYMAAPTTTGRGAGRTGPGAGRGRQQPPQLPVSYSPY
jgi:hypothetical protein